MPTNMSANRVLSSGPLRSGSRKLRVALGKSSIGQGWEVLTEGAGLADTLLECANYVLTS